MRDRWLPRVGSLLAVPVSLALVGCDSRLEPTTRPEVASVAEPGVAGTPATPGTAQPGFYPLAAGNRWVYEHRYTAQLIPSSGEAPPPEIGGWTVVREIVGETVINGRRYLEEQSTHTTIEGSFVSTAWYRQDATGLYEWAPPIRATSEALPGVRAALERAAGAVRSPSEREAFRRAADRLMERIATIRAAIGGGEVSSEPPPTAALDELTRLRYPLDIKSRWTVRDDTFFYLAAEVVGADAFELPQGTLRGYRLRMDLRSLGPNDFVRTWYGASGFLQLVSHQEVDAADPHGVIVGRYVFEERERLTDLALVRPSHVAPLPPWIARPLK